MKINKQYQREIKQLQKANAMIEVFCNKLEKTEIGAFNFYREAGLLMQQNAQRIELLNGAIQNELHYSVTINHLI